MDEKVWLELDPRQMAAARARVTPRVLILLNKPYGVLCQFTDPGGPADPRRLRRGAAGVYPAGRLDHDSEGLLLLTDDGALQARLADPRHGVEKTYWVQVEGVPDEDALEQLRAGVVLKDGPTRPARARLIDGAAPALAARSADPVSRGDSRPRGSRSGIREGRNRQVRRMTAAVGLPTLRLIRAAVGPYALGALPAWGVAGGGAGAAAVAASREPPLTLPSPLRGEGVDPPPQGEGRGEGLLEDGVAAVDDEGVAGVVAAGVARQVDRDAAEVVAGAPAAHRACAAARCSANFAVATAFSVMSVSIQPGRMALARTLWRANSTASARIIEITPPLVAA